MVMPRTETMPGFNHIELDEVHTPSRYFASAFIILLGGPLCFFPLCFLHPVANQVVSFLCRLAFALASDLSEACLGRRQHGTTCA